MKIVIAYDTTTIDKVRKHAELPTSLQRDPKTDSPSQDHMAEVEVTIMNPSAGLLRQSIKIVFLIVETDEGLRYREGIFKLVFGDTTGIDTMTKFGHMVSTGLPAPSAVEALCFGLGFKGRLTDWMIDRKDDLIVVVQKMETIQ